MDEVLDAVLAQLGCDPRPVHITHRSCLLIHGCFRDAGVQLVSRIGHKMMGRSSGGAGVYYFI